MRKIEPKNLAAHLDYRARGNPPSTHPNSAVSNAFPGLETDFRNAWRRIFKGIELTEGDNHVAAADDEQPDEVKRLVGNYTLQTADGFSVVGAITGPAVPNNSTIALEWSNSLAMVLRCKQGKQVRCVFQPDQPGPTITVDLILRQFYHVDVATGFRHAVIAEDVAVPGQLTQSLCSPWQTDYRQCACFYWAANHPDYINVEPTPDGVSAGNNWLEKHRSPDTPRFYIFDDQQDDRLVSEGELILDWEEHLRYIVGGRDSGE